MASPIWSESSPEKCEKTAQTPRLPRAITFPSKLRFAQTLYHWKVDIWGLMVCCMTHFEYPKDSKIALENRVRKLCVARIRHVANKNELRYPRSMMARGAAWWRAKSPKFVYKTRPPPLVLAPKFLGHFWAVIGRKCDFWGGFGVLQRGFLGSF